MLKIRQILARAIAALIVVAGLGFGVIAVGFALVVGAAFALMLRIAGPSLIADAESEVDTRPAGPSTEREQAPA